MQMRMRKITRLFQVLTHSTILRLSSSILTCFLSCIVVLETTKAAADSDTASTSRVEVEQKFTGKDSLAAQERERLETKIDEFVQQAEARRYFKLTL